MNSVDFVLNRSPLRTRENVLHRYQLLKKFRVPAACKMYKDNKTTTKALTCVALQHYLELITILLRDSPHLTPSQILLRSSAAQVILNKRLNQAARFIDRNKPPQRNRNSSKSPPLRRLRRF